MRTYLSAAAIAAALPGAAPAQDVIDLSEIVVTAESVAVEATRTGATVTVVDQAELEATAEIRLTDYLARLPGVEVSPRGPLGTLAGITIRGASQNYVQVLVDGIDVTDPSGTQVAFDFGALTTGDISRIEVLRGTQSALYGSEAVGGVISITTRRPAEDGLRQSLAVEGGSYGTLRGSYGVTLKEGGFEAAATLSRIRTDGFSAADENDGNTEADGYEATRLSFSGAVALDSGARIGLNGFVEDASGEYDELFPVSDGSPDERFESRSFGLRGFAEFSAGAIDHSFAVTRYRIERRNTGSTIFGPDDNTYTGARLGASYQGTTALGANARLSFGGDVTRESYDQTGSFGPGSGANTVTGIFAEYAVAPSDSVDITATLRYDDHSRFGGFATGRLAAAWQARPDLTFRASLASGFRAPSNYELFGPFGDPTLQPEESRTLDLGVEKRFADGSLVRATLFYSEVDNLIDFPFPYAQIPGTVRRKGLELEGDIRLSDRLRLAAAYTYTDAENPPLTAGNTWNSTFGRHDLSLGLAAEITDRLRANLSAQLVADRQVLPDYTVFNATVTYEVSDNAEAFLRIENLFDAQYQLREGYGTSDRAFYVGLRATF